MPNSSKVVFELDSGSTANPSHPGLPDRWGQDGRCRGGHSSASPSPHGDLGPVVPQL